MGGRLALVLAVLLGGCVEGGRFECSSSAQCGAGGVCEAIGGCSFADPACGSGRRFGSFSAFAGQCTNDITDGDLPDRMSPGDGGPDSGPLACTLEVALGGFHSCARLGTAVSCWGDGDEGQLGDGKRLRRSAIVPVAGLPAVAQLSAGGYHTCARTESREVYCWGDNYNWQSGDSGGGASLTPRKVSGLSAVESLACGRRSSCAIVTGGAIWCWGLNDYGQLGNGMTAERSLPVQVVDVPPASQVAVGAYFACAIASGPAGQVWCWGENEEGELGVGDLAVHPRPQLSMMTGALQVVVGEGQACARKADGSVWCWGWNSQGQLGTGMGGDSSRPLEVRNVAGVVELATRYSTMCAREDDDDVWCWGADNHGQQGTGSIQYARNLPQRTWTGQSHIAVGFDHTCAVGGKVLRCLGSATRGQLGNGARPLALAPIMGPAGPWTAATAGDELTCGIKGGLPYCWGINEFGQLGNGGMGFAKSSPQLITPAGGASFASFATRGWSSCALTSAGAVQCWGYAMNGELGNGVDPPPDRANDPVPVMGLSGMSHLTMGGHFVCARRASDSVIFCWGLNSKRQLALGDTTRRVTPTMTSVTGLDVVAGGEHACARTASMGVVCWGDDQFGQLGDGTVVSTAPVTVLTTAGTPLTGVLELVAGDAHTCARTATAMWCWGVGYSGQLGLGPASASSDRAIEVPGLMPMRIFAGGARTCAIDMAGVLKCWGNGEFGGLGNGDFQNSGTPVAVMGLGGMLSDVTLGNGAHTCARLVDGSLRCWGLNEYGELGDGMVYDELAPVTVPLACP